MPETDWRSIEAEYRAGQISIREIGRKYGVSHSAISKKAKKLGWTRDLGKKVRSKVKEKLAKQDAESVHPSKETEEAPTAGDIVDMAAERGAQVITHHRNDIQKLRETCESLRTQLMGFGEITPPGGENAFDALINKKGNISKADLTKAKNQHQKTLELHLKDLRTMSEVVRNLCVAQDKLIAKERQAFNLDELGTGDDVPDGIKITFYRNEKEAP